MNATNLKRLLNHYPLLKRVAWLIFAILFYLCGERFTVWLLEPERLQGGIDWLAVVLFPFVLILFFMSGRYLGCTTGQCQPEHCSKINKESRNNNEQTSSATEIYYQRPPGL